MRLPRLPFVKPRYRYDVYLRAFSIEWRLVRIADGAVVRVCDTSYGDKRGPLSFRWLRDLGLLGDWEASR